MMRRSKRDPYSYNDTHPEPDEHFHGYLLKQLSKEKNTSAVVPRNTGATMTFCRSGRSLHSSKCFSQADERGIILHATQTERANKEPTGFNWLRSSLNLSFEPKRSTLLGPG